ncbi:MAG: CapA family protein [Clostridiales bacterium]|nr:CapA family protein [Clostridiales bacterium]
MNASSEKSSTSLVFTGDIGFDRYMEGRWKDPGLLSEDLRNLLKSADHVITNVEGPIMEGSKNTENEGAKQLLHFMDPEVGDFLKGIGSDIWNICNNHIMDAGSEGIFSTLEEAKKHGVKTIGAGENIDAARVPVILPEAGGIGMFGVGYQRACRVAGEDKPGCFSWSDLDTIQRVINDIKSRCRWCIVVAHAGEEFTPLPSPYTRERYLKYLEMGADIVVAHHPHVPMNYETVGDKVIFYSLGNFIFDTDYQRSQFNTEKGLVVKLNFTESAFDFESYGIDIIRGDERIEIGDLPVIYQDVQEEEYKLLAPLSAKMLVAATKRQMTYLNPARFKDATEEEWAEHFAEPLRTGRVPGETLDFAIICPLAEREKEQDWKKSKHQDIVDYIQKQM